MLVLSQPAYLQKLRTIAPLFICKHSGRTPQQKRSDRHTEAGLLHLTPHKRRGLHVQYSTGRKRHLPCKVSQSLGHPSQGSAHCASHWEVHAQLCWVPSSTAPRIFIPLPAASQGAWIYGRTVSPAPQTVNIALSKHTKYFWFSAGVLEDMFVDTHHAQH